MKICVYGASSNEIDKKYLDAGIELGLAMARRGHSLVFGGGQTGMMGAVARGMAKGGGKMVGIQRYLDSIGATRDEIIAFGDGHNDAEMLRYAGIGVAMGNAEDDTKAVADYVTADIDDDGIAKALEHFGLI